MTAMDQTRERNHKRKSKSIQWLQCLVVYLVIFIAKTIPSKGRLVIATTFGNLMYFLVSKRRKIAVQNLQNAFPSGKSTQEIKRIARQSCSSLILLLFESATLSSVLDKPEELKRMVEATEGMDAILQRAKEIHEQSGGCLFVTPHLGHWECLPHLAAWAGIPLVIPLRKFANPYLENLLNTARSTTGQLFISKTNSLPALRETLRQGKSIGMLPDQSTMRGIPVDYFGRKASTTPVPAILAVLYNRPIVVTACCRTFKDSHYQAYMGPPIWPNGGRNEKGEILRLTQEMNHQMETIIRKYPEQYLWMHNRWKSYKSKRRMANS